MPTETTTEATEAEVKQESYLVLQRDPNTVESVTRWNQVGTLEGEGQYGYWPRAEDVGEKFGEGEYLLIKLGDGDSRYISGYRMRVAAERYFHEVTETEDAGEEADS